MVKEKTEMNEYDHFLAGQDALIRWLNDPANAEHEDMKELAPFVEAVRKQAKAEAWDERDRARPQYLGPDDGHYQDCYGYADCRCESYPNPYRDEVEPDHG